MSDSQVGARPKRSIRDHLFVLNSIINSVKQKEGPPIDIQVYDVKTCFDSLWLLQCCNYLYEAGVEDDKLALIYEGNKVNNISVKTPIGPTQNTMIRECVSQGSGLGPILCAVSIDRIGKDALDHNEHIYKYKGIVSIPPLGMIDDVAHVQECGIKSVKDNAYIVARFEQDKLELNSDKCHKMHIGKSDKNCPTLLAHNDPIEAVNEEKYLGDVITKDGKHTSNIIKRRSKCVGLTADINDLLNTLCLGQFHFKVAMIFRQAMLMSVMLLNSETWLRLSQQDLEKLESVDRMYLRKVLCTSTQTPKPALYLELGAMPIKFVLKAKRILYLHQLLKCKSDDMVHQVLMSQIDKPAKNDWCNVVEEDLESVGLKHLNLEDFQKISKYKMKKIVKKAVEKAALQWLNTQKKSKMKDLSHNELKLKKYLISEKLNVRQKKLAFKIRNRMLPLKNNLGFEVICQVCQIPNTSDSQIHAILDCEKINVPMDINNDKIRYEDIFGNNCDKILNIVKVADMSLRERLKILESRKDLI